MTHFQNSCIWFMVGVVTGVLLFVYLNSGPIL